MSGIVIEAMKKLYCGDNLGVLRGRIADESVDLIFQTPCESPAGQYPCGSQPLFSLNLPIRFSDVPKDKVSDKSICEIELQLAQGARPV